MKKLVCLWFVFILVFSSLCSHAESANSSLQAIYQEAELMMVQGDYLHAAEKFESLSTYSDASQMAVYCKALACAESEQYSIAISVLNTLGDFKDSKMLLQYYRARKMEAEAAAFDLPTLTDDELANVKSMYQSAISQYNVNLLFKDSMLRVANCQAGIEAVEAEETARVMAYNETLYLTAQSCTNFAAATEDSLYYQEAIHLYTLLGDYKDSAALLAACQEAYNQMRYTWAREYEDNHKFAQAVEIYKDIGDYQDCAERIAALEIRVYDDIVGAGDGFLTAQKQNARGFSRYIFVDATGEATLPCYFSSARGFCEGFAAVRSYETGKWGFINTSGEQVVPCIYDEVRDFCNGFAVVKKDSYYGYVNAKGQQITDCKYKLANNFSEGYAAVAIEKLGSGYYYHGSHIDENGQEFPFLSEQRTGDFCSGYSLVRTRKNGCYYIDKQRNQLNAQTYEYANDFCNGLALVSTYDDVRGYINTNNEMVYQITDNTTTSTCNGYHVIYSGPHNKENAFTLIDAAGNVLLTYQNNMDGLISVTLITDDFIVYRHYGSSLTYAIIDWNGNTLVAPEYWAELDYLGNGWFSGTAYWGLSFDVRRRAVINIYTNQTIELSTKNENSCKVYATDEHIFVLEESYLSIYDMNGTAVY